MMSLNSSTLLKNSISRVSRTQSQSVKFSARCPVVEEANAPIAIEVAESDVKQQTAIVGGGVEDMYGEDSCIGDHFITHWSVSVVRDMVVRRERKTTMVGRIRNREMWFM